MAIDVTQFHQTFFEESLEGLDAMENILLALDMGAPDSESIHTIFRAAHSIKGGAATFGFKPVADFTHVMETLLDEVREGKRAMTQELVDLFLTSVDCLRDMLAALKADQQIDEEKAAPLKARLEAALGNSSSAPAVAAAPAEAAAAGGWHIRFAPHDHLLKTGNDPVRLFRALAELGEIKVRADTTRLPSLDAIAAEDCYLAWDLELHGDITKKDINEVFEWVEDDCDLSITPLSERAAKADAPAPVERRAGEDRRAGDRRSSAPEATSIRVDITKIDALINMLGELVITQSMLSQLGEQVHNFDGTWVERLRGGLSQLELSTRELQEGVMRVRMLPISFAFQRFPRMVRDMCRKLGKQVELKLSGEQTELDKTVLEKIGDPLVHLVRNSLDHGIEAPEVRAAAGKPEVGTIHLDAYHQGGNIVIEISDDGAGLNRNKILAKARERGLVGETEELADEAVYDLIFQPGFSTADVVSDVSGRGVGMDVVRRNIQSLGGGIEVRSRTGQGSTFTIRLPLTLAIMDGQLVRIGGEVYIIPLTAILELLQIDASLLNTISNETEVYRLRDKCIPVIHPHRLFALEAAPAAQRLLVVVEGGGETVGLVVEEMLGQQQVVVKSLETNFKRMQGIAGATVLGDGTVALIVDIDGLIRLSRQAARRPALVAVNGGRATA